MTFPSIVYVLVNAGVPPAVNVIGSHLSLLMHYPSKICPCPKSGQVFQPSYFTELWCANQTSFDIKLYVASDGGDHSLKLLGGLNELIQVKCLQQSLMSGQHSAFLELASPPHPIGKPHGEPLMTVKSRESTVLHSDHGCGLHGEGQTTWASSPLSNLLAVCPWGS